jgi:hypothetical protein
MQMIVTNERNKSDLQDPLADSGKVRQNPQLSRNRPGGEE